MYDSSGRFSDTLPVLQTGSIHTLIHTRISGIGHEVFAGGQIVNIIAAACSESSENQARRIRIASGILGHERIISLHGSISFDIRLEFGYFLLVGIYAHEIYPVQSEDIFH